MELNHPEARAYTVLMGVSGPLVSGDGSDAGELSLAGAPAVVWCRPEGPRGGAGPGLRGVRASQAGARLPTAAVDL